MGQHRRMRFRMGQVERAAQGVTELVVQRHPDGTQARAAQPSTIESVRPRLAILRMGDNDRQSTGKSGLM